MIFNFLAELFYIFFPKLLWMAQFIFVPAWFFQVVYQGLDIPWLMTTFWFLMVAGLSLLGCSFLLQVFLLFKHRGRWQNLSKKTYGILIGFVAVVSVFALVIMHVDNQNPREYLILDVYLLRIQVLALCLAALGTGSVLVHGVIFLKWLFSKFLPKLQMKIPPILARSLFFLVVLYPIISLCVLLIWFFGDPIPNIGASRFFTINAAIKNTCFIDPKRDHCPHTLEEISYIEPAAYRAMLQGSQVQYSYYPETNTYTLVVRYSPIQAVVFDPRLTASIGVDFKEFEVSLVGTDRIVNPPDFEGPWEFPNWWKY